MIKSEKSKIKSLTGKPHVKSYLYYSLRISMKEIMDTYILI